MGCWSAPAGSPGAGVCESFDVLREGRASGFGRPTGTWQDVTRGRVPRYGRSSRRGLCLERLLGETECHAAGLQAVHSDEQPRAYVQELRAITRGSLSAGAVAEALPVGRRCPSTPGVRNSHRGVLRTRD